MIALNERSEVPNNKAIQGRMYCLRPVLLSSYTTELIKDFLISDTKTIHHYLFYMYYGIDLVFIAADDERPYAPIVTILSKVVKKIDMKNL